MGNLLSVCSAKLTQQREEEENDEEENDIADDDFGEAPEPADHLLCPITRNVG